MSDIGCIFVHLTKTKKRQGCVGLGCSPKGSWEPLIEQGNVVCGYGEEGELEAGQAGGPRARDLIGGHPLPD